MKDICLCFQLHQPYRLRKFSFFEIGSENGGSYQDDILNGTILDEIVRDSYEPANELMLELLNQYPDFRISYVISGVAIEQMQDYSGSLMDSFIALAKTGRVEFLLEPYAHSVSALYCAEEFKEQIEMMSEKLRYTFDIKPAKVLCNPELIYSGDIAKICASLGLEAVMADGNRPFLGGRSANKVYTSSEASKVKVLFRNSYLSDLIEHKFSRYDVPEYPITADNILSRIDSELEDNEATILYLNYETLGRRHHRDTGIFEFFRALPDVAHRFGIGFTTPSELMKRDSTEKISAEQVSSIMADNCINPWTRNPLQESVIEKLRDTCDKAHLTRKPDIKHKWLLLQSIDNLFYMDTTGGASAFSPYGTAYESYTNYMNVFSDFLLRLSADFPEDYWEGLNSYEQTIRNQGDKILEQQAEIEELRTIIKELEQRLVKE